MHEHDRIGTPRCDGYAGDAPAIMHMDGHRAGRSGFVRHCLHCVDSKGGALNPRPLAELRHGAVLGEVWYFDPPHLGDAERGGRVSEETDSWYVLVMMEDVSDFVRLESVQSCTGAAQAFNELCIIFGPPRVCVCDTETHFKEMLMALLAEALNVDHHFAFAEALGWWSGITEKSSTRSRRFSVTLDAGRVSGCR